MQLDSSSRSNLIRLLVIVDGDRDRLAARARIAPHTADLVVTAVDTGEPLREELRVGSHDIGLLMADLKCGGMVRALEIVREISRVIPLIVLVERSDLEACSGFDIEAITAGAADCLDADGLTAKRLTTAIGYTLAREASMRNARMKSRTVASGALDVTTYAGSSLAMPGGSDSDSDAGMAFSSDRLERVSERHRAEAEKEQLLRLMGYERERLDMLIATVPGIVWESVRNEDNGSQIVTFISDFAPKMLGYSMAELLEKPNFWEWISHEEDRDRLREAVEATGPSSPVSQYRLIARDGRIVWIDVRTAVERDAHGSPARIRGLALDISQRVMAEEALRQSEALFESFMNNSPALAWVKDLEGRYRFANKRLIELLQGVDPIGKDDFSLWPEGVARSLREKDAEVVSTKRKMITVDRTLLDEEERFWFSIKFPVFDISGTMLVAGTSLDLTERVLAETSLRKSEERFQLATRATNDVIWDWDLVENTIWWNENAWRQFGYSPEESETHLDFWTENIHPEDRDSTVNGIYEFILSTGENWSAEYRFRRADGSYAYVLDRGYLMHNDEGEPVRMIGAMLDITERKEAERELQEANDKLETRVRERTAEIVQMMARLEESNAMQKQFVANASHDLRTPLTVIRAELDLLLDVTRHDERTHISLTRIASETKRLHHLAGDLLLLATFDSHQPTESSQLARIDELLLECIAQLTVIANEKGIAWNVLLDEPIEVRCEVPALSRALMNILENAIKYSPAGSVVDVSLGVEGKRAVITITDRGIGIAVHDLPHIFDRFYRGDAARSTTGTGLGLAIVKAIVDAHRGDVTIASTHGFGTTVRIELPLEEKV